MKTKFFTLILALAASVETMFADGTKIGDLYYNLNATDQTAEVTYELQYDENNYKGLTTANIPASVTYSGTTYSVTSIGWNAFYECSSLTSVTIGNGVTSIGESAFYNCSSLTSIEIPNSVTSIGNYAFTWCDSLTSVTIGNSVTSIGYLAFDGCSSLTSVESPAILFNEAFGIFDLRINEMPSQYKHLTITAGTLTEEGFYRIRASYRNLESVDLANAENTELSDEAFKGCYTLQTLRLPAGLKEIRYMAVAECVKLQAIDIPATVESIGDRAFEDCRNMATVTFAGNALTSIGSWAFFQCLKLQDIAIPEGVTEIGDGAFYGCAYLADVSVPASARIIGDNAFALCSKMVKLTVNAVEPPAIAAKTFEEVSRTMPVYVPATSISAYMADPLWGQMNIIGSATAAETTGIAPAASKVLRNGEVLILRDGKTYTIQGVEVR